MEVTGRKRHKEASGGWWCSTHIDRCSTRWPGSRVGTSNCRSTRTCFHYAPPWPTVDDAATTRDWWWTAALCCASSIPAPPQRRSGGVIPTSDARRRLDSPPLARPVTISLWRASKRTPATRAATPLNPMPISNWRVRSDWDLNHAKGFAERARYVGAAPRSPCLCNP